MSHSHVRICLLLLLDREVEVLLVLDRQLILPLELDRELVILLSGSCSAFCSPSARSSAGEIGSSSGPASNTISFRYGVAMYGGGHLGCGLYFMPPRYRKKVHTETRWWRQVRGWRACRQSLILSQGDIASGGGPGCGHRCVRPRRVMYSWVEDKNS